ncbi:MAG: phosphate acyltransferase PlsX [Niameybacter sp.]|uniref:phosphate acyltransferase PlsX n=1 Tax=Niameybacter sp. TaxID=2033640 RepID=UPI002FC5F2D4
MPKIAVDIMGGDYAPDEVLQGCILASKEVKSTLVLVGNEARIREKLKDITYDSSKIEIVDAQDCITMEDHPVSAIRSKKDSSMVVGLKLIKDKKVDGFVSAGNSGALLAGGTLIVGRIRGVERPALAPIIPTKAGNTLLIDCGANMDAKPSYLTQFARMGTVYMQECMSVKNPKVGLINVGTEEEKGNSLTKEAYQLLKEDEKINFIGNIEAREISTGEADVLVCDAFIGNVVLKFMEGFGMWVFSMLKAEFKRNWITKLAAVLMMKGIKNIKQKFDYASKGGAPLLGVNGLVVKTHGNSKREQICATILQTEAFIENQLVEKIASKFS